MPSVILSLAMFVLVIVAMIILRVKVGEKFEIKYTDIILAVIPIVLWLLLTGKIPKLKLGELEIEMAFKEASKTKIAQQITPLRLPVEPVRMDPKRGVGEIPRLIKDKTEALFFQLGHGGYYGPAIEEYLRKLSEHPFFKYIIISGREGTFTGLADGRELNSIFMFRGADFNANDFARWLNSSDTVSLSRLPGYISASNAIRKDADKQTALERMEALDSDTLPVMDEQGKFAGIVDRSRLTASLIIDVANKVK